MSRTVVTLDLRNIGRHMGRQRYQRGILRTNVPAHGDRPEQKLARGEYWAQWYQYVRQPDGSEKRRRREKIITRELAEKHHIGKEYPGPLTKVDAQRVLDLLIAQEAGSYIPPDTAATVEQVARAYIAIAEPGSSAKTAAEQGRNREAHHRVFGPTSRGRHPSDGASEMAEHIRNNRRVQEPPGQEGSRRGHGARNRTAR